MFFGLFKKKVKVVKVKRKGKAKTKAKTKPKAKARKTKIKKTATFRSVRPKAVGKVTHYFPKAGVAVVELSGDVKVGDNISIEGRGNVVEQAIESMEIEHKKLETAKAGDEIGLKVNGRVKQGDHERY